MKLVTNNDPAALRGGDMTEMDICISDDPEDQLMILNILSSSLYSDKPKAVLREYGCNAFDANVEAGLGDTPIEVRLPNAIKQTCSIRDFGAGMTEEQIRRVFCRLGKSTKRNSNDFIGMLGIGSKAGFAYGDYFTVTSYSDGTKSIYNCFRDKGVPKMALMHTEASSERDGIEVEIPVKQTDIHQFAATAEKVFRYFKVRPNITGAEVRFKDVDEIKFKGSNWRYRGDGVSAAIMGNVGYDLSASALGVGLAEKHQSLISAGIELEFAIGELEVAPNREGLQYTDATKKTIIALLDVVNSEISAIFTKQISVASSLWEAKKLYGDAFEKMGSYEIRKQVLQGAGSILWKGKKITGSEFEISLTKLAGVSAIEYYRPYGTKIRSQAVWQISPRRNYHLVENDTGNSIPRSRVRGFFEVTPANAEGTNPKMVLFHFDNQKAKDAFIKAHELEGAPWTLLSTIPKATIALGSVGTPSQHKAKHSAQVFEFDENAVGPSYRRAGSTWWKVVDVDLNQGGVYVPIENFCVMGKANGLHSSAFAEDIKQLKSVGLLKVPVYGFKKDKLSKLTKDWVTLDVHVQAKLDELITKKKLAQEMADYFEYRDYTVLFAEKHRELLPKGSLARKLMEECHRMGNPSALVALLKYLKEGNGYPWIKQITTMPKPTVDLDDLEDQVKERYPMIPVCNFDTWRTTKRTNEMKPEQITKIADYISLVESELKTKKAQKDNS